MKVHGGDGDTSRQRKVKGNELAKKVRTEILRPLGENEQKAITKEGR